MLLVFDSPYKHLQDIVPASRRPSRLTRETVGHGHDTRLGFGLASAAQQHSVDSLLGSTAIWVAITTQMIHVWNMVIYGYLWISMDIYEYLSYLPLFTYKIVPKMAQM